MKEGLLNNMNEARKNKVDRDNFKLALKGQG